MRILMLNNEFPPLGGGTGTVTENVLHQLASFHEIEIDLITSAAVKGQQDNSNYLPGVRIFRAPVSNKNLHHATNRELLGYAWHALWQARKLMQERRYTVCLAFATVPAGAVALGLWYEYGLPYVVRVSGPELPGFERRYRFATRLLGPGVVLTWKSAHKVVAKCPHEKKLVERLWDRAPIALIPNTVDVERFRPALSRPSVQDGTLRLLSVARLIERKGQHYLLEAGRMLRDKGRGPFRIILVGEGDAEAALKAKAKSLEMGDLVEFRGYVPREQLPTVYREADIFVLPSANEAMSLATLEAMATGLPVVLTTGSGLEELVDGNGLTFAVGDVPALAAALGQLMASEQLRRQMGERGRQIAKRTSWEQVGQTYYELLCSVAADSTIQQHQ